MEIVWLQQAPTCGDMQPYLPRAFILCVNLSISLITTDYSRWWLGRLALSLPPPVILCEQFNGSFYMGYNMMIIINLLQPYDKILREGICQRIHFKPLMLVMLLLLNYQYDYLYNCVVKTKFPLHV